ncbi:MAG: hypothetical protein AAB724_00975 [Patescibacteria group bacterium]
MKKWLDRNGTWFQQRFVLGWHNRSEAVGRKLRPHLLREFFLTLTIFPSAGLKIYLKGGGKNIYRAG